MVVAGGCWCGRPADAGRCRPLPGVSTARAADLPRSEPASVRVSTPLACEMPGHERSVVVRVESGGVSSFWAVDTPRALLADLPALSVDLVRGDVSRPAWEVAAYRSP